MATILKGFDRDDVGFLFLLLPATLLTNICTYDYYYYTIHTHNTYMVRIKVVSKKDSSQIPWEDTFRKIKNYHLFFTKR